MLIIPSVRLKTYIRKYRLSQEDFARRVGVSQSMVSQWLTGKRPIGAARAVMIERKTQGEITREDLLPKIFRRINGEARAA